MAVSAVSAGGSSSVKSSSQSLAANFDTFLKLLTTQRCRTRIRWRRWTPTSSPRSWSNSPRSSRRSRPTASWASLARLIESSRTASAMGMLGREVTATDRVGLAASGDAQIRYWLPEVVTKISVTVMDAQGRAVRSRRQHRLGREPGALGRPRWHRPTCGRRQLPDPRRGYSRRRHHRSPPSSISPAWSKGSSLVSTGSLSSSPGRKGADGCRAHRARAATHRRGRIAAPPTNTAAGVDP